MLFLLKIRLKLRRQQLLDQLEQQVWEEVEGEVEVEEEGEGRELSHDFIFLFFRTESNIQAITLICYMGSFSPLIGIYHIETFMMIFIGVIISVLYKI
jgi:hypothetical protein